MTLEISRQTLLDEIISVSKEIIDKTIISSPDKVSFDDERQDRKFCISNSKMWCSFHRYEHREPYYAIRLILYCNTFGGTIVISNAFGNATIYIDDGNYGKIDNYNEEKMDDCLSTIYGILNYWLNNLKTGDTISA